MYNPFAKTKFYHITINKRGLSNSTIQKAGGRGGGRETIVLKRHFKIEIVKSQKLQK